MSVGQTTRDDPNAPLDELALRVLAFEAHAWQQPGVKAAGIRDEFDM